jgi:hypothetical protein
MKRRQFIHAAAASLLLPVDLTAGGAALAVDSPNLDYAFFDERFRNARRVAASWSALNGLVGVHGDITPVWTNGLDRTMRERSLALRGITTQSFQFCLRVLAAERAHIDVQASRIDRYLYLWTMRTTPKSEHGMTSWPSPSPRV